MQFSQSYWFWHVVMTLCIAILATLSSDALPAGTPVLATRMKNYVHNNQVFQVERSYVPIAEGSHRYVKSYKFVGATKPTEEMKAFVARKNEKAKQVQYEFQHNQLHQTIDRKAFTGSNYDEEKFTSAHDPYFGTKLRKMDRDGYHYVQKGVRQKGSKVEVRQQNGDWVDVLKEKMPVQGKDENVQLKTQKREMSAKEKAILIGSGLVLATGAALGTGLGIAAAADSESKSN